jgi:dCTP deaminase
MILSAQSIRKRNIILPFEERTLSHGMTFGIGPAGYDVRIAESMWVSPGEAKLASVMEHIVMPRDVLARVHDKSTWARRFLAVQNTIIEPGWRGHLTLELSNHGMTSIKLQAGMPIAQIIFELLDEPTEQPYDGKYQDQGTGATKPIFEHPAVVGGSTYRTTDPDETRPSRSMDDLVRAD